MEPQAAFVTLSAGIFLGWVITAAYYQDKEKREAIRIKDDRSWENFVEEARARRARAYEEARTREEARAHEKARAHEEARAREEARAHKEASAREEARTSEEGPQEARTANPAAGAGKGAGHPGNGPESR